MGGSCKEPSFAYGVSCYRLSTMYVRVLFVLIDITVLHSLHDIVICNVYTVCSLYTCVCEEFML